eukprot:COSAG01_NODE_1605_length_9753_cov_46.460798_2_plen_113_part_00
MWRTGGASPRMPEPTAGVPDHGIMGAHAFLKINQAGHSAPGALIDYSIRGVCEQCGGGGGSEGRDHGRRSRAGGLPWGWLTDLRVLHLEEEEKYNVLTEFHRPGRATLSPLI